jgi:hypothetical protein
VPSLSPFPLPVQRRSKVLRPHSSPTVVITGIELARRQASASRLCTRIAAAMSADPASAVFRLGDGSLSGEKIGVRPTGFNWAEMLWKKPQIREAASTG